METGGGSSFPREGEERVEEWQIPQLFSAQTRLVSLQLPLSTPTVVLG